MKFRFGLYRRAANQFFLATSVAAMVLAISAQGNAFAQEQPSDVDAEMQAKEVMLRKMEAHLQAQQKELAKQRDAMAAQQKSLQQHQQALAEHAQQQQRAREMAAIAESQRSDPMNEYAKILKTLEAVRGDTSLADAWKQKVKAAPLPENAEFRIFALRNSKLPDVSRVLAETVGERGMRIAMDERTNSLIVISDKETMSMVEALLQRLDESPDKTTLDAPLESLQLKIVWLVDGVEDNLPQTDESVSQPVVDALRKLGLTEPRAVCQQVSTLTLGKDNRRGRFQFELPVLVNREENWQLSGNGLVSPVAGERFGVEFEMQFARTNAEGRANQRRSQLGGSIYTPLGHYTVMGTTTFIEEMVGDEQRPKQRMSAFVVYLDRAPEFPAAMPTK